jgi:beta-glucosidase
MLRQNLVHLSRRLVAAARKARLLPRPAPICTLAAAFPKNFIWGVATASYQIEGAVKEDGRGESIWDRFSHTEGKIKNGDTGDVAVDHYHRFPDDIRIMREMGIKGYRFSIAWPRIQPTGQGKANQKGLDFYSQLVDRLLEVGIEPFPTLYHWDLPQALEDAGGWPNRDTAGRFADYVHIAAHALSDRVNTWTIFNEPWMFTTLGYLIGSHAPGRTELDDYLRSTHVVNLAQGMAFKIIKNRHSAARVGSAFSMWPCQPATNARANQEAAERAHKWQNIWFLHPAMRGSYPDAFVGVTPEKLGIRPEDMDTVRANFDFIGINNYLRTVFTAADSRRAPQSALATIFPVETTDRGQYRPRTDLGWEVYPRALYDIVMRVTKDYNRPAIAITENGCAYNDGPGTNGVIDDQRRIEFHRRYLTELARAIRDGADVRGYYAWSLLDNFEWAEGYRPRFGLVYVDLATQKRTVKESGHWYAKLVTANAVPTRPKGLDRTA